MYITKENIKNFVGKMVDCHHRMHHYYPLTICQRDGEYFYVDATATWIRFDDRDMIYYDVIRDDEKEEAE